MRGDTRAARLSHCQGRAVCAVNDSHTYRTRLLSTLSPWGRGELSNCRQQQCSSSLGRDSTVGPGHAVLRKRKQNTGGNYEPRYREETA